MTKHNFFSINDNGLAVITLLDGSLITPVKIYENSGSLKKEVLSENTVVYVGFIFGLIN